MDAVSSPPAPAGVGAAKCVAPEVEGPDVVDSGRALQGEKERTSDRGGSVREEGRGGEGSIACPLRGGKSERSGWVSRKRQRELRKRRDAARAR